MYILKVNEKNTLKCMKTKIIIFLCITGFWLSSVAQNKVVLDQVVAVVGTQVVTKSDIEMQLSSFKFPDQKAYFEGSCEFLISAVYQRLLLHQANIDSIEVKDEEVLNEVNRRLDYFISQMGSKEALEKYYEKTVNEIREEMKEPIMEMKKVQQMRNQITGSVIISPTEVKDFYESIPNDSLPYYNTQVEVSQIVFYAKASAEEEEKAKSKINEIRKRILKGDKFSTLAILYSEDPGSATRGGDLGMRSRFDFVPEFSAAAMKLKKDSISPIIRTQFGFHILKMVDRKGERVHVKHILIKPKTTSQSKIEAEKQLLDIRFRILNDTLNFKDAAFLYSEDETTKNSGGAISDPESGASRVPIDKIDATMFFTIDTMQIGSISMPMTMTYPDGRLAIRIIYLKSKTLPHKANLKDDYVRIKDMAENYYQMELLQTWINKSFNETFVTINSPYDQCEGVKKLLEKKKISQR